MAAPVESGAAQRIVHERLIATAASEAYAGSVLALLGSLRRNWPGHPPVLVYDLGMATASIERIRALGIEVRSVPPFCAHWRKHFTWKPWCWCDAPALDLLWLDAGVLVLDALDEVLDTVARSGIFVIPANGDLALTASDAACEGCRVDPAFRAGLPTFAGGVVGFRKSGAVATMLTEALRVAMTERFIAATEATHRHDQAILSLLIARDLGRVCAADGVLYGGWLGPDQAPGQRIWVHRGRLAEADRVAFIRAASTDGPPVRPAIRTRGTLGRAWRATFRPVEQWGKGLLKWVGLRAPAGHDGIRDDALRGGECP